MHLSMPRSKLKIPPLRFGEDATLGQRIARIRKARGYTQQELADRIGIIQVLVSDYERGKLRVTAEMAVRFARALELSTDELLGMTEMKSNGKRAGRSFAGSSRSTHSARSSRPCF